MEENVKWGTKNKDSNNSCSCYFAFTWNVVSFDAEYDLKKEMREKTLYERVRDSEVFGLLCGIDYQTSMLPPDGKRNHGVNKFRTRLLLRIGMMEEGHFLPRQASISDYRTKEPLAYKMIMELLEDAERDFKIDPTMLMRRVSVV